MLFNVKGISHGVRHLAFASVYGLECRLFNIDSGRIDVFCYQDARRTQLERKIRAHGNFIENVPTFLLGLLLLELIIGSGLWVATLGAIVVIARLAHALALMANSGVTAGRLIGTFGTVIPLLVIAGYLIVLVAGKL